MKAMRSPLMKRLAFFVCTPLLLVAPLFCCGPLCFAAAQAPISIEANRMVSQENDQSVIFVGKVVVKQGGLTIRAEEMTVLYRQGEASAPNNEARQLDRLICKNNVRIVQGDWLGTGDRMDYYAQERKVVLSGNAQGWNGPNMVAGKTITYYLDEKRSVVDQDPGAKTRVRAVIHPDGSK